MLKGCAGNVKRWKTLETYYVMIIEPIKTDCVVFDNKANNIIFGLGKLFKIISSPSNYELNSSKSMRRKTLNSKSGKRSTIFPKNPYQFTDNKKEICTE